MTYDVPYAFVPGTKAKADEVNANFNDIIQKLQDTNGSVEEQFSTVNNQISQLTSGLSTANTNIAKKANSSDIDGSWTTKNYTIFGEKTWAVGTQNLTYSLNTYLPNDNNTYEIIFSSDGRTGASSGAAINCHVGSSLVDISLNVVYRCLTRTTSSVIGGGNCIVPIAADRKLNFSMNVAGSVSGNCYASVLAYRKVR